MQICYLTYGEPVFSQLLQTQAVRLLQLLSRKSSVTIEWVAFISPVDLLFHREEMRRMRREVSQAGITLTLYPLPILYSRYFLPRAWLLPWLIFLGSVVLSAHFGQHRHPKLIHARGYMATLLTIVSRKHRNDFSILFDPRSLFPEENVTAGNWTVHSIDFALWKRLEAYIMKRVDTVVGVSAGFKQLLRDIPRSNLPRFAIVPCTVDTQHYDQVPVERDSVLKELGMPADSLVIAYTGSIGRWNSPKTIARYFYCAWCADSRCRLLVITNGRFDHLERELLKYKLPLDTYCIVRVESSKVARYLKASDVGLQVMEPALDSPTRLGVKFAEYMAAGLPVIVNRYAGAAKDYVETNGVGVVVDQPENEMGQALTTLRLHREDIATRCRELAHRSFDVNEAVCQYALLYDDLLKPTKLLPRVPEKGETAE